MNIAQFCKEFNDRTKHIVTGVPIPTIIHYKVIINAIINAKMSSEPENSSNRKLPRMILPPRWGGLPYIKVTGIFVGKLK